MSKKKASQKTTVTSSPLVETFKLSWGYPPGRILRKKVMEFHCKGFFTQEDRDFCYNKYGENCKFKNASAQGMICYHKNPTL